MNTKNQNNHFAAILSVLLILIGFSIVFFLHNMTLQNQKVIESNKGPEVDQAPLQIEPNQNKEGAVIVSQTEGQNLNVALSDYQAKNLNSIERIKDINNKQYKDNLLESQDEIVAAILANDLDSEELGYLFLPENPAHYSELEAVPQIDVPLLLQKDAHWRTTNYGTNTTKQLGENGCAILSLAMVHSALSGQTQLPETILDWSKEHYYVDNEGTSWQIFADFADQYQYQFTNYGNNFYEAMQAVQNGEVVVASVDPGYFTNTGHILVIRGYADGKVYVNDPNDDPLKMFSIQGIDEEIFLNEGANYWSYTNF